MTKMEPPSSSQLGRAPVFFLYGYYGAGNLGDDLLLTATIDGIRKICSDAQFIVRSHGMPAGLPGINGAGVDFVDPERLLSAQDVPRWLRAIRYLLAYWQYFELSDWLVFGGGTLFHATRNPYSLLMQLAICILARLRRMRIAAIGVGISKLPGNLTRALVSWIAALCDVFVVRDRSSLAQLPASRALLGNDLAFTLSWPQPQLRSSGQLHVAIALVPTAIGDVERPKILAVFRKVIADTLSAGGRVSLIPFQDHGITSGDRELLQCLFDDDIGTGAISIVSPPRKLAELAQLFASFDVYCGMRFHGLVLAALAGRPFIGLSHDTKISDFCRRFEMPCFDIQRISSDEIIRLVNCLPQHSPSASVLQECRGEAALSLQELARHIR